MGLVIVLGVVQCKETINHVTLLTQGLSTQGVNIQEVAKYVMVTTRTATPTILLPVLQQMDKELEDTEWILNKLKAEMSLPSGTGTFYW